MLRLSSRLTGLLASLALVLPFGLPAVSGGARNLDLSSGMASPLSSSILPGNEMAIRVASGGSHTCTLTSAGGVKCWGDNYEGQLGDGTTSSRLIPAYVAGLASDVIAIAAGSNHTCGLTATGGVRC